MNVKADDTRTLTSHFLKSWYVSAEFQWIGWQKIENVA